MPPDTIRAAMFLDKGGTGKTTAAAHLGVALTKAGHSVLLIDLAGKQGDLIKHFGVWDQVRKTINTDDDWPNISTVFQDQWDQIADRLGDAAIEDLIIQTGESVDLIPAHPGLDGLDDELGNIDDARDRYTRLNRFLTQYIDPLGYDAILIDLPGLSNNVSYNGLWAAQHIVAPVEMGPFEHEQSAALRDDLESIAKNFDVAIHLTMVLPNKVDQRTTLADEYLSQYQAEYPDAIAPEPIPVSQDIRNAADQGRTVFALEEPSATAQRAQDAFIVNARALADRITNSDQ